MDRHKGRGQTQGKETDSLGWGGQTDRWTDGWVLWKGTEDWIGTYRWTDGHKGRGWRVWVGVDRQTDTWIDAREGKRGLG